MPQIPVYGGSQVRTQQLPGGAQATPDVSSTARAVGAGLGQVAEGLDRIVERDIAAEADAADAEITTGWLKWDAENRSKYQGKNAGDYAGAAEAWWKQTAETYGKNLSPQARQRISSTLVRKQGSAMGDVARFVGAEKERHADDVALKSAKGSIELGVTTGATEAAALRVREISEELAARKGWTPEQKADFVRSQLDDMHAARALHLSRGDAEAAAAYADAAEARGELSGVRRAQLKDALQKAASEQRGQKLAMETAKLPFEERLAKAAEIADPVARKAAEHDIMAQETVARRARADRADQVEGNLLLAYQRSGRRPAATEIDALAAIDSKAAARVNEAIDKDIRARLKEAQGHQVKTDIGAYFALRDAIRAAKGNVTSAELLQFRDRISRSDLEELGKLREELQKDTAGKIERNMFSEEQVMRSRMPYNVKPESEDGRKLQMMMMDALLRAKQNNAGKPLDDKQMADAIDTVFEPMVVPRSFLPGTTTKPFWQLSDEELPKASVVEMVGDKQVARPIANIGATDRAQLVANLLKAGIKPTEANVAAEYQEFLRRKAAAAKPTGPVAPNDPFSLTPSPSGVNQIPTR